MNIKKVVIQLVSSLLAIGAIVGLILVSVLYGKALNGFNVSNIAFLVLAFICACIYLYFDYTKTGSLFYKLFMIFVAVSSCILVIRDPNSAEGLNVVVIITALVSIACYVILAVGKDLGRRNTLIILGILVVCTLTSLIYSIVIYNDSYSKLGDVARLFLVDSICRFVVSLVAGTLVLGKYADKEERGRKL